MAKLSFFFAAMSAGKSTQLLKLAATYADQGQSTLLFTAAIDNRAGVGRITSRQGPSAAAFTFDATTNFHQVTLEHPGSACLLIDEAQFLSPCQVMALHQIAALDNVPVKCFGLRSDFRGEPFQGSAYLMALADELHEVESLCCGLTKATMNVRLDDNGSRIFVGDQVLIGGNERYRSVCPECFYTGQPVWN